jgi:hypothetical protein
MNGSKIRFLNAGGNPVVRFTVSFLLPCDSWVLLQEVLRLARRRLV